MNRIITLTFQFYRLIGIYNIAFSVIAVALTVFGGIANLQGLFFSKITGLLAAIGFYHFAYSKSYFYFRNAGLSIRRLWLYVLIIDTCIFIIALTTFTLIAHAISNIKG